ncbi:hypothetical protein LAZ67_15001689 [Cordylochernes scorpioides]|uniref:Uncharacterized protein n=1 Tax=Cordylochernes scorpioides TaxID=51811 RepID=A0ABY6L9S0_9ARAC|nr:hypothetical protein LAZ67_15001689 [Cordylochernes scorpioides]
MSAVFYSQEREDVLVSLTPEEKIILAELLDCGIASIGDSDHYITQKLSVFKVACEAEFQTSLHEGSTSLKILTSTDPVDGPQQGSHSRDYGGAASVLMLESAAKASASMLGTASNYKQSQTFTKVCLDHGAMINESCTPTPHSMRGIRIENNNKIYPTCPKCSLAPAAPEHILACIRCNKQELWESPLLIMKELEEHGVMEFITCIKFCVKNEIKCADAFRMLTVAYGEATLDRSNVYRW